MGNSLNRMRGAAEASRVHGVYRRFPPLGLLHTTSGRYGKDETADVRHEQIVDRSAFDSISQIAVSWSASGMAEGLPTEWVYRVARRQFPASRVAIDKLVSPLANGRS